MTKALFITTVASMIRSFLLPFAAHYRGRGWQVDALGSDATNIPELAENFDHAFDINWTRSPLSPNFFGSYHAVRRLVEEQDYDLIHVHSPIAAFITRVALHRRGRRPAIIYTANGFHFNPEYSLPVNTGFLAMEKFAGRWTDVVITINGWDNDAARRFRLAPRIEYIPGIGVDTQELDPARIAPEAVAAVRAELGLAVSDVMFLCVAELNENKRHRDLIRALQLLSAPEVHLVCAGVGDKEPELRRMADELGVGRQVHLLGFRRDVPALMRASRAVLLASRREGLPRCLLEAQALAVAGVGTDIRGTRDLLSEGRGLLVRVGGAEGFARALDRLRRDPAEAEEMGRKARELVVRYDTRLVIARHDEIYASLLGKN
jgi:glycosyltransferase involved in cell wall biosynthesis